MENREGFDRDSYLEVNDLLYTLNCQTGSPAPIKFRLGILREYNRDRQFTPIIFNPLADLDSRDYRVLWLRKKSNNLESIGPNPSHEGAQVFYDWGLERAARDSIIKKRLFSATKYAVEEQKKLIQSGNPHGFKMLRV